MEIGDFLNYLRRLNVFSSCAKLSFAAFNFLQPYLIWPLRAARVSPFLYVPLVEQYATAAGTLEMIWCSWALGHQRQLKNCRCAWAPRMGSGISGLRIHINSTNDRQWPVWGEENLRDLRWQLGTAGVGSCLAGPWVYGSKFPSLGTRFCPKMPGYLNSSCKKNWMWVAQRMWAVSKQGVPSIDICLLLRASINTISDHIRRNRGVMNHWYLHVPHYEAFGQFIQIFPSLQS